MYGLINTCHPEILHFLLADIALSITCKELNSAQVTKFWALSVIKVNFYLEDAFSIKIFMLMKQNVNNDVSKDSPIFWHRILIRGIPFISDMKTIDVLMTHVNYPNESQLMCIVNTFNISSI